MWEGHIIWLNFPLLWTFTPVYSVMSKQVRDSNFFRKPEHWLNDYLFFQQCLPLDASKTICDTSAACFGQNLRLSRVGNSGWEVCNEQNLETIMELPPVLPGLWPWPIFGYRKDAIINHFYYTKKYSKVSTKPVDFDHKKIAVD